MSYLPTYLAWDQYFKTFFLKFTVYIWRVLDLRDLLGLYLNKLAPVANLLNILRL